MKDAKALELIQTPAILYS